MIETNINKKKSIPKDRESKSRDKKIKYLKSQIEK